MKVVKPSGAKPVEDKRGLFFGGEAFRVPLVEKDMARGLTVTLVKFGPGGRNKMHTHSGEQVLYVTEGKGIVATQTEEVTVTPGMVVYFPAGEPHWHGATPTTSFAHLSIMTQPSDIKF